jgi:hypothetical protein
VPNLVVVKVGSDGRVQLFNGSAGTVQVLADVAGYVLDPVATTGSVAVRVTDAGGAHPLAGVWVSFQGGLGFGEDKTSADGTLTVSQLPPDSKYEICFDGADAVGGSFDGLGYQRVCRSPVAVTAGSTTSLSAALSAAGAVGGKVTDAGGTHAGLENVSVSVSTQPVGGPVGGGDVRTALTAKDGSFVVKGLATGTDYLVCFDASDARGGSAGATGYLDECYDNATGDVPPTKVTVTAGSVRANVNAALTASGGGGISGTVADAGGAHHGLSGVDVTLSRQSTGYVTSVKTAADGTYAFTRLDPAADYEVCFDANEATGGSTDALGYVGECFDNQPTGGAPTPVSVVSGAVRTGVNGVLSAGGAVSGTVTDAAGTRHGLDGVSVQVVSDSTGSSKYGYTAADGSYRVTGLAPATDYRVCFSGESATGGSSDAFGYADECFDNRLPADSPTPVVVTAGAARSGVNAALTPGGVVSGHVTEDSGTHAPIMDAQVTVIGSDTGIIRYASTDQAGGYAVRGLVPGTYEVCFEHQPSQDGNGAPIPGHVAECYADKPTDGSLPYTPVTVTSRSTTTVNAALTPDP